MPEWFISAVATGGPAAALIMTYMWWHAEKRAAKYEDLWVKANEKLPEKIMDFAEQHRKTNDKLTKAIRASMQALSGGARQGVRFFAPSADDLCGGGEDSK